MISESSSIVSSSSTSTVAAASPPTLLTMTKERRLMSDSTTTMTATCINKKPIAMARLCRLLPIGYKLDDNDVFCGRGKSCFKHIGNCRFRATIMLNLNRYHTATTKSGKTSIIFDLVDHIRNICQLSGHGIGFVKRDRLTGRYFEAGDMIAREKVSQAFRDASSGKHHFGKLLQSRNDVAANAAIVNTVDACDDEVAIDSGNGNNDNDNDNVSCPNEIIMDISNDHANELQASLQMDDVDKDSFWDCDCRTTTTTKTTKTTATTSPSKESKVDKITTAATTTNSLQNLVNLTTEPTGMECYFFRNPKTLTTTTTTTTKTMTFDNLKLPINDDYFMYHEQQQIQQQQRQQPSILYRLRQGSICSTNSSNSSTSSAGTTSSCNDSCNNNNNNNNNNCYCQTTLNNVSHGVSPVLDQNTDTVNNENNDNNSNLKYNYIDNNCINNNNHQNDDDDVFTFLRLMDLFSYQQQDQMSLDVFNLEPRPL